jgi:hypothetical protein
LSKLTDYNVDDVAVRERDAETREKGRLYAYTRRGTKESNIQCGDKVFVRQDRENKMSTPCNPFPFKEVERTGNSVVEESDEAVQYTCRRNVIHRSAEDAYSS